MRWIDESQAPAGDRMAPIASRINADYAEFCDLLVEADRAQEWLADGSPNIVQWISARFGIDEAFGRRLARLAKRLQDLPELRKRLAAGDLSLDAVDLLAEVATPDTESELIDEATGRDLHDIARLASREKPPANRDSAEAREAHWFSTQWDLRRQKMRLAGELTGMEAQVVEDRLVGVAKTTPKNPETGRYDDWEKRMADSLFEVCATRDGKAPVPTTVVHADFDALIDPSGPSVSELGSGPVISTEVARMIGCDSALEMVLEREGKPVGIGRRSRNIPGWLRRQVEYRDHHCRFPGCGRTVFLQIHHLEHWADGGKTDFDSLVLLCWWHHIFIHEKGWHVTRDAIGRFVFRKPDWRPYPPRPT
ncbi:MAG TPA: DUF222 domain-containing protein [Acidimicrobiia bacterium]|nr:DUF222 domain-containing protein [Acidimicrobiia bacterium]